MKTNLFGWHPDGPRETEKLLALFRNEKWEFERDDKGSIWLRAPFEFHYRILYLADNGGEINVGFINTAQETSLASTWHSLRLGAETMWYRIISWLRKEAIDWDYTPDLKEDKISDEEWETVFGVSKPKKKSRHAKHSRSNPRRPQDHVQSGSPLGEPVPPVPHAGQRHGQHPERAEARPAGNRPLQTQG